MKEIIIQGTPHPIHFGLRAIDEFVRQRGAEFGQTVASNDALGSLDSIVALTATGLNEGARRAVPHSCRLGTLRREHRAADG